MTNEDAVCIAKMGSPKFVAFNVEFASALDMERTFWNTIPSKIIVELVKKTRTRN